MSSLVNVERQTETLQAFELIEPADMLTALQYLGGLPAEVYSGTINMLPSGGGWQLLINNTTHNLSAFANLGDWIIVENGATISVCPDENFEALYSIVAQ